MLVRVTVGLLAEEIALGRKQLVVAGPELVLAELALVARVLLVQEVAGEVRLCVASSDSSF